MRSIWKGSISFGLVNIPVKLFNATQEHELKFVMLHKKDLSAIRYAKICKEEEKEIPWEEVVKGFEYEKGEYVLIDEGDFEKANLKRTKTIEIISFVDEEEVDLIYYEKPYYLEPEKNAINTYHLLEEALRKTKKVGIAKYVIHNREHIAVLKSYENILILNQLRFDAEVLKPSELEIPKPAKKTVAAELDVAIKLINHLTRPFVAKELKDTYTDEIKKIISQKAKGKKIHPKQGEPRPTKVHDIMALLKASLEDAKPEKKKRVKRSA